MALKQTHLQTKNTGTQKNEFTHSSKATGGTKKCLWNLGNSQISRAKKRPQINPSYSVVTDKGE